MYIYIYITYTYICLFWAPFHQFQEPIKRTVNSSHSAERLWIGTRLIPRDGERLCWLRLLCMFVWGSPKRLDKLPYSWFLSGDLLVETYLAVSMSCVLLWQPYYEHIYFMPLVVSHCIPLYFHSVRDLGCAFKIFHSFNQQTSNILMAYTIEVVRLGHNRNDWLTFQGIAPGSLRLYRWISLNEPTSFDNCCGLSPCDGQEDSH